MASSPSRNTILLFFILSLITTTTTTTAQSPSPSPSPTPSASPSILSAADALSSSGYLSMSLVITLIIPYLPNTPKVLTIFSPPDSAFSTAGQPSFDQMLLHFCPVGISESSLLSLTPTATLPSLSPFNHLIVTDNDSGISINNVTVAKSPIYDDGFVIVYTIDNFFDLNFKSGNTPVVSDAVNYGGFQCLNFRTVSRFSEASGVLKSRGYSIVASFLDLQLIGHLDRGKEDMEKLTVFAPFDKDLIEFSGDFLDYGSIFHRHVVPCRLEWNDFDEMENGTVISNNFGGFGMVITKDDMFEMIMVNGVEITFPDMYESDSLMIHGMQGLIQLPAEEEYEVGDEDNPTDREF